MYALSGFEGCGHPEKFVGKPVQPATYTSGSLHISPAILQADIRRTRYFRVDSVRVARGGGGSHEDLIFSGWDGDKDMREGSIHCRRRQRSRESCRWRRVISGSSILALGSSCHKRALTSLSHEVSPTSRLARSLSVLSAALILSRCLPRPFSMLLFHVDTYITSQIARCRMPSSESLLRCCSHPHSLRLVIPLEELPCSVPVPKSMA